MNGVLKFTLSLGLTGMLFNCGWFLYIGADCCCKTIPIIFPIYNISFILLCVSLLHVYILFTVSVILICYVFVY